MSELWPRVPNAGYAEADQTWSRQSHALLSLCAPRFEVGEAVFFAAVEAVPEYVACPDCLGAGEWAFKSPAGDDYTMRCPRCRSLGFGQKGGKLHLPSFSDVARPLTIGAIQINTAEEPARRVSYLCQETGIGSGTIYFEDNLFADADSALAEAVRRADASRVKLHTSAGINLTKAMHALPAVAAATLEERDRRYRVEAELESLRRGIRGLAVSDVQSPGLTQRHLEVVISHLLGDEEDTAS